MNKTPIWKTVILLVCLFMGVIYAVPNLYGDDPAVQVSATRGAPLDEMIKLKLEQSLKKQGYQVKRVEMKPDRMLIRFVQAQDQLNAKDLIKAELGDNYSVALNLAPATPAWLSALGATPMKLGLDLRGGVHFLLSVDVDSLIESRLSGDIKTISHELRQEKIRYTSARETGAGIVLSFRDGEELRSASTYLKRHYPELTLDTPNDLANQLRASIIPAAFNKMRLETMERTMTTLRNRINELGVSEAVVQQQGSDRVAVDLPGIQDTARAKQILGGTATLEFKIVDEQHDASAVAVPLGSQLYHTTAGRSILLKQQVVLSGNSITFASTGLGEDGRPVVNIRISGGEVGLFNRVTRNNVGKRMGIVYIETQAKPVVKNGKVTIEHSKSERVISAPVINSALGSSFQISGIGDASEARNLALLLRSGALPAPISIIEEQTVGPSLGAQNIARGIVSLQVGLVLIVLLMAIYYRVFGLIADVALGLNLILLVALLSILGMTLTLPGIAGIVLTLGMAVDGNVLIFERIREELRNGMTPQASIHAGFERALETIIDSNVTTLIVAIVLFLIGTGPIKGFAVTLSFGLLTSMLTAVTYTRAMVNHFYGGKQLNKLAIGI